MLRKCKTVLLLTDVASFASLYTQLADSVGVKLIVEEEWNDRYRVKEDVVILGSKYLDSLNKAYYSKAVIILKSGENPAQYIKMGISRFVFNYENQMELLVALFSEEPVVIRSYTMDIADIVKECGVPHFCSGDYDFRFDKGIFMYKNKQIYLCESQKQYLAQWLLAGKKDNSKRMTLCNLRKKFGADFLADIDRFGNEVRRIK